MQTLKRNLWLACLFLFPAVIAGITATGTASQVPPRQQNQNQQAEERRKALEKLLQDLKTGTQQPQTQGAQPPAAAAPAPAPGIVQRTPLASGDIQLNYNNVALYDFITQIADLLKITPILIDPDVKGSAYIYSSASMPAQEVFPIFMAVLKNNNAALVKSKTGNFYRIVPISQGLKEGLDVVETLPPPPPPKPEPEKKDAKPEPEKKDAGPTGQIMPPAPGAAAAAAADAKISATTGTAGGPAGQKPPVPVPAEPAARPAQTAPVNPDVPRLATHIVRVEYVPVQILIEPLKLFMSDGAVIMPYERQNMLIITDYTDSMQKIMEIIRLLDNSFLEPDLFDLVEIKNNLAADVLEDLRKIFGGGKDTGTGVYLTSLDRLNAIMIMANSKRALEDVKRWIARLDTTAGRSVQTFIYTVQNGTASNIAMVLSMLFGGGDEGGAGSYQQTGAGGVQGGAGGVPSSTTRGGGGISGGVPSYSSGAGRSLSNMGGGLQGMGGMQQGGYGGSGIYGGGAGVGGGVFGGQPQIGARLNQGPGMTAQVLNAGQFSGLQGPVRLVADDLNNSLIIQGSPADYAYLLETIIRMDVLPRQVLIDARIFEIDLSDALSFGVSAALQARTTDPHLTTGSITAEAGALAAQTFAFIGSSREILANLDALRVKTKVRVLEAPSVLAIDGMQAHIQVGGSVPVPGGTYVAAAGGSTTSVGYTETGTMLDIVPRISASGTVTLQIAQNVIIPGAQTSLGPTFNQTSVSTTLAVKDGESVAIAGLIRESDTNGRNGVPFLSDIPILGALFGRTSRSSSRTELLILITPHVIRTPDRFHEITEEIKDSLRNVGKFADDKLKQILDDKEKSRKEREEQIKKQEKKAEAPAAAKPPDVIKKEEKPPVPPPVKK